MRSAHFAAPLVVAGLVVAVAGCRRAETPAKVCAAPQTQDKIADQVFDAARALIPTLAVKGATPEAIRAQIDRMHRQHMLVFDTARLDGVDSGSGRIDCEGLLRLHLAADDQLIADQSSHYGLASVEADNSTTPSGASSDSVSAELTYSRRPGADAGAYTYTAGDTREIAGGLAALAAEIAAANAQKTTLQAPLDPANVQTMNFEAPSPMDDPAANTQGDNGLGSALRSPN